MPSKVFYSWQNPLDPKRHRWFIRDALRDAIARLRDDPELDERPELDSDTAGVAGSPNIVDTIFGKIDDAAAFVADLTTVHRGTEHAFPNPNVLIETGYAIKSLGHERMVCVINTAEGSPKDVPFDLNHHRVTTYSLPLGADGAELKREGKRLSRVLEEAIGLILRTSPTAGTQPQTLFEAVDSEALREATERAGGRAVRYQVTVGAQAGGAITPGAMCEALKHASSGKFPPTNDPVALHLAERLAKKEAPAVGVPRPYRFGRPAPGPRGSTLWRHFYGREGSSDAGEEMLFVLQDGTLGYQRVACSDGLAVALLLDDVATFLRLAGHAWFNATIDRGSGLEGPPEVVLRLTLDAGRDDLLVARTLGPEGLVDVIPPARRWSVEQGARPVDLFVDREGLGEATRNLVRAAVNRLAYREPSRIGGPPFVDLDPSVTTEVLRRIGAG